MSIYEASITNPKKQLEFYKDLSEQLQQENQSLKKQLEEYKKWYQDGLEENSKLSELWCDSRAKIRKFENQQKEFINYLEDEKDRLARECSNVYEDGLGRTRLVNEDIFDEIDNILQKYREIIGE